MRSAWSCPTCHASLGKVVTDHAGSATLLLWPEAGASVIPSGRDFDIICPCGERKTFRDGLVKFIDGRKAA